MKKERRLGGRSARKWKQQVHLELSLGFRPMDDGQKVCWEFFEMKDLISEAQFFLFLKIPPRFYLFNYSLTNYIFFVVYHLCTYCKQ
jgi:hypothetical protein